jgi:hypothetical protein
MSFYHDTRREGTPLRSWQIELGGRKFLGECFQDFGGQAVGAKVEGIKVGNRKGGCASFSAMLNKD